MLKVISLVFDRKKTATTKREGSVEIRITSNRKQYYIATGIRCNSTQWKNGKVVKRLDCDSCNETLIRQVDKVREITDRMGEIDIEKVRRLLTASEKPIPNLFDWWEERINSRPLREATRKQHLVSLNFVKSLGIVMDFEDLTVANLKLIDEAVRRKVKASTTVYSYHKRMKPYFKDAVLFGYIERNPYDFFATPHGKSERIRYLTDDERKRIETTPLFSEYLTHVRDCFLFSCYTGLAYADASSLKRRNFVRQDGSLFIVTKRVKNGTNVLIKVVDKARIILERYDYKIPYMSNQKYNLYLKVLAAQCGIKKRLTSHMARHTFATTALHQGIPIEIVSKMLAHTNIQTTQIYAKVLAEDIKKGFDQLEF